MEFKHRLPHIGSGVTTPNRAGDIYVDHGMEVSLGESPTTKKSDKAKAIEATLRAHDFGCHTSGVAKVCSVLLGEEISPLQGKTLLPWTAVVPLKCENGHNYEIGKVALVRTHTAGSAECRAIRANGTEGNALGVTRDTDYRFATKEEILEGTTEAQIEALARLTNVVFV